MSTAGDNRRLSFDAPIHEMEARLGEMQAEYARSRAGGDASAVAEQIRRLRRELAGLKQTIYANLEAWQQVQVARHVERPQSREYIDLVFDEFIELHGDRAVGDDGAIVTGLARLDEHKIMFVGHQKGRNLSERTACNFGMPHPEGYRKAILKMQTAEKFGLPIVTFIDTPGAYPGIAAEERGQALVIAENLLKMSLLKTPIISVVIGEGGSGGALGIGVADRLAMLEHAYYSVITPEGCATILWKSSEHWKKAAEALRMTSRDLLGFGIIDEVVPEPLGGAHRDHREAASTLKSFLLRALRELVEIPRDVVLQRRYEKYRRIGVFFEGVDAAAAEVLEAVVGSASAPETTAETPAPADQQRPTRPPIAAVDVDPTPHGVDSRAGALETAPTRD